MNQTIDIVSLDETNKNIYMPDIVDLYRRVFSESNWQEGLKCMGICDFNCSYSNVPLNNSCPNCGEPLTDFYSQQDIEQFVQAFLDKDYYQGLLWINNANKVVAFTWWWFDSLVNLNNDKLWLSDSDMIIFENNLRKNGMDPNQDFYYQSETWVDPDEQWRWFGNQIIAINQKLLQNNVDKIKQILQRTSRDSRMFNMRLKQWYNLVYDYSDTANRVLFWKPNRVWKI